MAAPVAFTDTGLDGVYVIESKVFRDDRGYFMEAYSQEAWAQKGLSLTFVQDNISVSSKGALRGMHYQIEPHGMGKLVRVTAGSVFDVAVDIRKGSPTFGKWVGYTLSGENHLALWVPPGFAHGFLALEDNTMVYYKCTSLYAPMAERSILYNDPALAIDWPIEPKYVSDKDAAAPLLEDAEYNFVYNA